MTLPAVAPLRLASLEPVALEMSLDRAVVTPFATVRNVVALFVRARDEDGAEGWGEAWCNFPRFGHRHRARIVAEVLAPALVGRAFDSPADAWLRADEATRALRLQSGEPGPFAAAIAGVDIALWDLAARNAGLPLWRMLGGKDPRVPVYASLARADDPRPTLERALAEGFRAFKVRSTGAIGDHLAAVRMARAVVGEEPELALDVNGTWEPEAAIATIDELAPARLAWVEEPLAVDAPDAAWRRLAQAAPMPLAGGENLIGADAFDAALASPALRVLQPDLTKWGGISGGLPLARRIVASGRRLAPHVFAGAPGLLAAAHLFAAGGSSDGILEYGVGRHPARDALLARELRDGAIVLGEAPGLGLPVDTDALAPYRVAL